MSDDDLTLAVVYLDGYLDEDARGRLKRKFLRKGSSEEKRARAALARLLWHERPDGVLPPLAPRLRQALAKRFDPESNWIYPPFTGGRFLEMRFHKGKRGYRDHVADSQVAGQVWERVCAGEKVTDAIGNAAGQFGIEESRVRKLWAKYRRTFGYWSAQPSKTRCSTKRTGTLK